MMRESELKIKHDTEVAHISREGYVREVRGELVSTSSSLSSILGCNFSKLLRLRGINSLTLKL